LEIEVSAAREIKVGNGCLQTISRNGNSKQIDWRTSSKVDLQAEVHPALFLHFEENRTSDNNGADEKEGVDAGESENGSEGGLEDVVDGGRHPHQCNCTTAVHNKMRTGIRRASPTFIEVTLNKPFCGPPIRITAL
jgi:hypothetical protein